MDVVLKRKQEFTREQISLCFIQSIVNCQTEEQGISGSPCSDLPLRRPTCTWTAPGTLHERMGANPEGSGSRGVCPSWDSCGRDGGRQFRRLTTRSLDGPGHLLFGLRVPHNPCRREWKCDLERGTRGLHCFPELSGKCLNHQSPERTSCGDAPDPTVFFSAERSSWPT